MLNSALGAQTGSPRQRQLDPALARHRESTRRRPDLRYRTRQPMRQLTTAVEDKIADLVCNRRAPAPSSTGTARRGKRQSSTWAQRRTHYRTAHLPQAIAHFFVPGHPPRHARGGAYPGSHRPRPIARRPGTGGFRNIRQEATDDAGSWFSGASVPRQDQASNEMAGWRLISHRKMASDQTDS